MSHLAQGVVRFKNEVFPKKKELFAKLALGQTPEALFVTCSDSRVDPNLLTQTEPGELFICRNAGNIIPPYNGHTGAMTASVEFAVGALHVPHIVICGHTECGAMDGAMHPERLENLPHVHQWLCYASAAVSVVKEKENSCKLSQKEAAQLLLEENVLLQMQHIRTHPTVAARLAAGKLQIHGWIYDIQTGAVTVYDRKQEKFVPVEEFYKTGEES